MTKLRAEARNIRTTQEPQHTKQCKPLLQGCRWTLPNARYPHQTFDQIGSRKLRPLTPYRGERPVETGLFHRGEDQGCTLRVLNAFVLGEDLEQRKVGIINVRAVDRLDLRLSK